MHAIKTFELPRIDFRMMCGDITQSDLRGFDRWLRGKISSWLRTPGIIVETFLMSWRDGGFTIPSLEERQYTMLIRTMLDMMSTVDIQLLKIMRQFEKEEAEAYNCRVVERDPNSDEEGGGFLRWYGPYQTCAPMHPSPRDHSMTTISVIQENQKFMKFYRRISQFSPGPSKPLRNSAWRSG
jgi:hypothetical protein